jgi:hypothetical protein
MNKNNITLLAEMVDSYNLIHADYLKTDSILESEFLLRKLKSIEKDILQSGACIELSIKEWESFLLSTPDLKSPGNIALELIPKSLDFIREHKNYFMLDKVLAMEEEILLRHGKHSMKKEFYKGMEILKQLDEKTIIKNVIFSEYLFIEDQAINLLKENIKAV